MELKKNGVKELDRYYISNCYEIDDSAFGGIKEKLYLGGDFYSAPAVYVKEVGGSWNLYYICRDYLGSITHITDSSGSLVQELSYDVWGRLRNPVNQTAYNPDSEPVLFLGRGYTGHEHLTQFGLINMNARLYDPAIGRFLSPDPFVQNPLLSQNFNRYSYAMNNPMKYTDPNGEFWHLIIGAAIGGVVNWGMNGFQFNSKGLGYFGVGALAGALGAGVGAGISSMLPVVGTSSGGFAAGFLGTNAATTATTSFVSGALIGGGAGFASGFTTGIGNDLLKGGSFGHALGQGGIYGAIGLGFGALIGGVVGGISALRDGREFLNGARMIDEQSLSNQNLPLVQQRGEMNCGPATGESTTGVSQDTYRARIGGTPNDPVTVKQLNDAIHAETGRTARAIAGHLPTDRWGSVDIAYRMNNGSNFYLCSVNAGESIGHATALNSVAVRTFQKISGDLYYKVVYQAMDPARGVYRIIGANSMKVVVWIRP